MEALLLLLLFPLAWPFIAKRIWHTTINWQEMALNIVIVVALTAGVWQLGKYGQTSDTEIWNGHVISKERKHDHYLRPYACNCRTECSGSGDDSSCSTECDTCYEDRYTVTWSAETTVSHVVFDHRDSAWHSVYSSPDPSLYTRCITGEPASDERAYTNYVRAVPESLFHQDGGHTAFADSVPSYPRVYDFYRINRVLQVGVELQSSVHAALNDGLSKELVVLGVAKQVNIVLIVTSIADPSYRHAVENAWLGGKKNDVVLFLGVDDAHRILWADAMTWALNTGNELFQVKMRDGLKDIGTLDPSRIVPFVSKTISAYYDRPHMRDFEYLKDAVKPPLWVIIFAILLAFGGSIGLTYLFHRTDIDFFRR